MSSKRNKKDLDEELSSSEEEVDVKKNVKKAQNAPAKKAVKKDESIESSDEDVNMLKGKSNRKMPQKKKLPPKKEESSDDDDDSEEDVKPKKANVTAGKKVQPKKESSSDDDDSEEEPPKKTAPTKKAPAKKESSSEDDDSDEDDKPKKAAPAKKAPVKKEESSDDDDDDDSEDDLPKKPVKKAPAKKEESSDDDDDEDEDDEPKKPVKKAPAKKEESSDEEDEDEEEDKKPKKEDEDAEDEVPPEAFEELFVRNLSFQTTEESLANFFMKFGDVEVARILTDKSTGKSRGIAFVKFYEKKAAYAAMKSADNLNLDSRQLQIRYSNDKSYQSGQSSSGGKKPSYQGDRHSIFVGNLSFKCNENSIRKHFSSCGNVVDIRLAKRDDGKLKGFAHVDFDSEEGVQKALELNGKELDGRALKIDVSTPKQSGGNRGGNRGGRGGRGGNRGGNVDPLAKAKKSGAIITPSESKVKTFDDSDDE